MNGHPVRREAGVHGKPPEPGAAAVDQPPERREGREPPRDPNLGPERGIPHQDVHPLAHATQSKEPPEIGLVTEVQSQDFQPDLVGDAAEVFLCEGVGGHD